MSETDERRIQTRHPVDIFNIRGFIQPVKEFADIVTPTGSPLDFHMMDFSAEGYRVQVYEPIKAGERILVNFQGIGEWGDFLDVNEDEFSKLGHILREGNDINCLGVVKWREGMNAAKGFQIGIHLREDSLQHKFHSYFSSIVA
jgi:hypothetical protein